MSNLDL